MSDQHAESVAGGVQIHKAPTGLSSSLDGRDIAAFSWVPGMSEEAQDAAVLTYAEQVRAAPMADESERPGERVRAIFDREILEMEANMEPSPMVEWLERLRDEVLAALLTERTDA